MNIGGHHFDVQNHTYIWGILNVTPDSFSDGGRYTDADKALAAAGRMIEDGASVIDIGGESTRPGYIMISEEEEIKRVVPVIEAVKKHFDIPVSIDTYKSRVAEVALSAGADLVNDIWGLKYDPKMAELISEKKAACCLMHNRVRMDYRDFLPDVLSDMRESLETAKAAGIREDGIIIDPGVGFAKTCEMNLEIIKELDAVKTLGYPVLLGTSRKSVIGKTLDLPANEREEGTLATTVFAVMKGCAFVRVHDVKSNMRAVRMTEAILRTHDTKKTENS